MTTVDTSPFWPTTEDWTGFLLVIVPLGRLAEFGEDLRKRVRTEIESDPVLYDLVSVAVAPAHDPSPEWCRDFLGCVVDAAMPNGYLFAPRVTIGVVVVGGAGRGEKEIAQELRTIPVLSRLEMCFFHVRARADPEGGVASASVQEIAATVTDLIGMYDAEQLTALSERAFLREVSALAEKGDLRLRAAPPVPAEPQQTRPSLSPSRLPDRMPDRAPVPAPRPLPPAEPVPVHFPDRSEAGPEPAAAQTPTLPMARPSARRVKPVIYDGAEVVNVDQRTTMQRLTRKSVTDADTIDELRNDGRAVGLVQLVFVPDDGVVARSAARRRTAIALELDEALASVRSDGATGAPAQVAVEIFSATDPVRKHGVLHVAGKLTEAALPRVNIEYFSLSETVDPLLDAARRTSRALQARGVDIVSLHVIFFGAMRFPADDTTENDWARLLEHARVTWIDFSPPSRWHEMPPMPESPFGLHVLTDKEDVVAVIRKESEVLYRYAPQDVRVETPAVTSEEPGPQPRSRHWWQLRKRTDG